MRSSLGVIVAAARLEALVLLADRVFLGLTALAALSFLALVSLFGLTGSRAPVALIDADRSPESAAFVRAMEGAHHSFSLRPMSPEAANELLLQGRLVASVTIPAGFGEQVRSGDTVALAVVIDNVDVDLTDDIERAMPSAVVAFGRGAGYPGLRVQLDERDTYPQDTSYLQYLAVSAIALDSFVIAGTLGALVMAREFERGTRYLWRLAPVDPVAMLTGKLLVAGGFALVAMALALGLVVFGFRLTPVNTLGVIGCVVACVAIFTCFGAWVGALVRRSAPVVPLMFGLSLPLYLDSGALEPTRFDGESVWLIAHGTPLYYAISILQAAFHGLTVTPEPALACLAVLFGFGVISLLAARDSLQGFR